MSKDVSSDQLQSMVDSIHQAIEARKEIEQQIQDQQHLGVDPQEQAFDSQLAARQSQFEMESGEAYNAYTANRQQTIDDADAEYARVKHEFDTFVEETNLKHQEEQEIAEQQLADNEWILSSVLDDSAETSPKRIFENFKIQLEKHKENFTTGFELIESSSKTSKAFMDRIHLSEDDLEPQALEKPTDESEALRIFSESVEKATEYTQELTRHKLVLFFSGFKIMLTFLFVAGIFFLPLYFLLDPDMFGLKWKPNELPWIGSNAGIACFFAGFFVMIFSYVLKDTSLNLYSEVVQAKINARESARKWMLWAKKEIVRQKEIYKKNQKLVDQKLGEASEQFQSQQSSKIQNAQHWKQQELTRANEEFPNMLEKIVQDRDRHVVEIDQAFQEEAAQKQKQFEQEFNEIVQAKNSYLQQRDGHLFLLWDQLKTGWNQSLENVGLKVKALDEMNQKLLLDWNGITERNEASEDNLDNLPEGIPMGRVELDLDLIEEAIPENPEIKPSTTKFEVPIILPFPEKPSLLLRAHGEGREEAIDTLQTAMLRFATLIPAGKIRFTIIDPVGLGENFSAFMHLGDYDELLISSRIWTKSSHIEGRLNDLTEHMENIFQKYLRNEFTSIEDYNKSAGEVAEPYHILVAANFPVNFTETAARRLVSIATSGPRCGVYTLVSVDEKSPLPSNFELADLEAAANTFVWKMGAFRPFADELRQFPVHFDKPPEAELFTKIVKDIGHRSKDIRKVEVPFEKISPKELWQNDSRKGIHVPLGRAGALKLQDMALGKGTSQHVLIAGKTGSGKSTFLHALIVNLSLHYSPEEVEFYLIDFKKGVEFKTYAKYGLPHARVIGIESDREFGVSVLDRLNEILKERGDLFRESGVQDIAGFRNHNPDVVMPRIMLIVDEFQEFFIEDDALSQKANLALDRLVRQGRAFGVHVLLGSQTLGGAYSLARSTLGQVAVRIALQCSENDAHLILSETNSAARLLTRPGEAIYNDANGMMEGNHPFQIAWLDDSKKDELLIKVRDKAIEQGMIKEAPIVFEGNIPSEPDRNAELVSVMNGSRKFQLPQDKNQDQVWLGEAVAIGDPTQIIFYRQAGNNLLIVGQSPEPVLGILSTAVVGLAAKWRQPEFQAVGNARFYVLVDSDKDQEYLESWNRISKFDTGMIDIVLPDRIPEVIQEIGKQAEERKAGESKDHAPIYLVIYNIGRFRDLRKDDDDFGYSSMDMDMDDAPSPGKTLSKIYSEGPESGIHSLVWSDTYSNVDRWFSRKALKDFELKIAFQMNSSDSSSFVESPVASRLGTNRALFYMEQEGSFEKFRPYGVPTSEWLETYKSSTPTAQVKQEVKEETKPVAEKPTPVAPPAESSEFDELSQMTDSLVSGSPIDEVKPSEPQLKESSPESSPSGSASEEKKPEEKDSGLATDLDEWDIS